VTVHLYDEGTCEALRVEGLAEELRAIAGVGVEVRGEFVRHWATTAGGSRAAATTTKRLAEALVRARVVDPMARFQPDREPMPVEIAAERRALETPGKTSVGILYDGAVVQWLMAEVMDPAPLPPSVQKGGTAAAFASCPGGTLPQRQECHVILTARLLGTWMAEDRRWHAHTALLGEPAMISTTGLVQAPARSREYYQGQALATSRLVPREVVEAELQRSMADRMLLPGDARITQAALGCALQAIAFHVTGSGFCETPTCRLFNARRQEDLVRSQCSDEAGLCPQHEALFAELRGNPSD
jgi:hypothetical protein